MLDMGQCKRHTSLRLRVLLAADSGLLITCVVGLSCVQVSRDPPLPVSHLLYHTAVLCLNLIFIRRQLLPYHKKIMSATLYI